MTQRVDAAMMEVMEKLQLIIQHLQKYELNGSCNKIAKCTNDIVAAFMEAAVSLPQDQMEIRTNLRAERGGDRKQKDTAEKVTPKGNEVMAGVFANPNQLSVRQANTWARVIGDGVEIHPDTPVPAMALRAKVAYSVDQVIPPCGGPARFEVKPVEPKASTLKVIGAFPRGILSFLTSKIREGPLYKVDINAVEGYAEITFQQSEQAANFIEGDRVMHSKHGYGRFGPAYSIVGVTEFEWDADIRRMAQQPRERRRLTFARARLIGNNMNFTQFQAYVAAVAGGADAIDIAWAYNTGNVTMAFKSVRAARLVRQHFVEQSIKEGPFKNVQVTFSTDPCEKPLFLGTQMSAATNNTAFNNHWVDSQKIENVQANIKKIINQPETKPKVNSQPLKAQRVNKQQPSTQQSKVTKGGNQKANDEKADPPKYKTIRRGGVRRTRRVYD
ncbi:uncharacterized protein GIQ15_03428 [Arthroderma uncinatum]|uniref:uncharacterized protein n=1 Tax=Arthroderma uncinatum TaxID=74035 RepID=UPI00144A9EF7|nr:uncharacterized protein GIQ15_03428 [Arthroderma uncinatum]KAF3484104.1 hypothetical protein GIQ15_03428 [Arthroderma uncinatum]